MTRAWVPLYNDSDMARLFGWVVFLFLLALAAGAGYYWYLTRVPPPDKPEVAAPEVTAEIRDPLEEARSLADGGSLEEAAAILEKLAVSAGGQDNFEVRRLAGEVLTKLGRHRAAYGHLAAAREISPDDLDIFLPVIRSARNAGLLDEALSAALTGIELAPDRPVFELEASVLLLDLGRAREALKHVQRARSLEESSGEATADVWGLEGRVLARLGRDGAALSALRKASKLGTTDGDALGDYGLLALKKGLKKEAYQALVKSAEIKPANAEVQYRLAILCDDLGRRSRAVHHYRMALIVDMDILAREDRGLMNELRNRVQTALIMAPGNPETLYQAGFISYLDGDLEEALSLLEKFLARDRKNQDSSSKRAALRREAGELVKKIRSELFPEVAAVPVEIIEEPVSSPPPETKGIGVNYELAQSFQNRIRRDPENPRLHYYLGLVYLKGKDSAQAVRSFKKSLALSPNTAEVHLYLGAAHHHQGMSRDAVHHLQEAIRLVPQMADAHARLGAIYLKDMGNPQQAIPCLERAVEYAPEFSAALSMLGDAHRTLGDTKQASYYYCRAAERAAEGPVRDYAKKMAESLAGAAGQ